MSINIGSPPTVSVFIPTYNRGCYLPQCIDSILAQTYQNYEIVIVDDGSTDNSLEVLKDYQCRYPEKIRYHWHAGHANRGVAATSNLAIRKSRGKYLAWTGSDDMWHADKLQLQVAQLDCDSSLGMVYSFAEYIDEQGRPLGKRAGLDVTSDPNPVGRILQYCHPPAMTTVIRRQCLDDVGICDESLSACEDWHLWIRVFANWKVGFIGQPLAQYRLHGRNLSKGIDPKKELDKILTMFHKVDEVRYAIGGGMLMPRNQAILDLQLAFHLFCYGRMPEATARLDSAFRQDPSLVDDSGFLGAWLEQWKPEFYTPEHSHFGFWVIENLPETGKPMLRKELMKRQLRAPETKAFFVRRGIGRVGSEAMPAKAAEMRIFGDCMNGEVPSSYKADVLKEVYACLMFDCYSKGDVRRAKYFWRKAVQSDWTRLANRGVRSMGLRLVFGGLR